MGRKQKNQQQKHLSSLFPVDCSAGADAADKPGPEQPGEHRTPARDPHPSGRRRGHNGGARARTRPYDGAVL